MDSAQNTPNSNPTPEINPHNNIVANKPNSNKLIILLVAGIFILLTIIGILAYSLLQKDKQEPNKMLDDSKADQSTNTLPKNKEEKGLYKNTIAFIKNPNPNEYDDQFITTSIKVNGNSTNYNNRYLVKINVNTNEIAKIPNGENIYEF